MTTTATTTANPHRVTPALRVGAPMERARLAVILLHGRGQGPADALALVERLALDDVAFVIPAADAGTWYPQSFLAPRAENQPRLDAALDAVVALSAELEAAGVPRARQVLMGFSQGACLACEAAYRRLNDVGFVVAFTGGVIGAPGLDLHDDDVSLAGLTAVITGSSVDAWVPAVRMEQTAAMLRMAGARVTLDLDPRRGHEVDDGMLALARQALLASTTTPATSTPTPTPTTATTTTTPPFVHQGLGSRVHFGAGSLARLGDICATAGFARVLVVSTPGQRALADRAASLLGERCVAVHDGAVMHVPVAAAEAARAVAKDRQADAVVAVGGGSAIGLAKAIALTSGLPIVAVPTTFSGSEMTRIWGLTTDTTKQTGRADAVLPRVVVYDPDLLRALPRAVRAASGLNAAAHAVEALYAKDVSPVVMHLAEDSVRRLARALPRIVAGDGHGDDDDDALAEALIGAWLAGSCLGSATMGLHHKLCHTLGGTFGLPHAETHAIVLPYALAFNAPSAPAAVAALSRALGTSDPAHALWALGRSLGLPPSLRALGMPEAGLTEAADRLTSNPYDNPAPVTRDGVLTLLRAAFEGRWEKK